ncbi:MAG: hypothetical protein M4579_004570 [Chaenotheca gracillima]|nr:MAG: hypothetical protein M4579_004570 [Chaenotheca gracillima]
MHRTLGRSHRPSRCRFIPLDEFILPFLAPTVFSRLPHTLQRLPSSTSSAPSSSVKLRRIAERTSSTKSENAESPNNASLKISFTVSRRPIEPTPERWDARRIRRIPVDEKTERVPLLRRIRGELRNADGTVTEQAPAPSDDSLKYEQYTSPWRATVSSPNQPGRVLPRLGSDEGEASYNPAKEPWPSDLEEDPRSYESLADPLSKDLLSSIDDPAGFQQLRVKTSDTTAEQIPEEPDIKERNRVVAASSGRADPPNFPVNSSSDYHAPLEPAISTSLENTKGVWEPLLTSEENEERIAEVLELSSPEGDTVPAKPSTSIEEVSSNPDFQPLDPSLEDPDNSSNSQSLTEYWEKYYSFATDEIPNLARQIKRQSLTTQLSQTQLSQSTFLLTSRSTSRMVEYLFSDGQSIEALSTMWGKLGISQRRSQWSEVALFVMVYRPLQTATFLNATYIEPLPPKIAVANALDDFSRLHKMLLALDVPTDITEKMADEFSAVVRRIVLTRRFGTPVLHTRTLSRMVLHMRWDYTFLLLQKMLAWPMPMDADLLCAFLRAAAKRENLPTALLIWKQILRSDIDVTGRTFLRACEDLFNAFGKDANHVHLVPELVSEMVKSKIKPNNIISNIMIAAELRYGSIDRAKKLRNLAESHGFDSDPITFSILLNDAKRRRDYDAVNILVRQIVEREFQSDPYIMTDLLHHEYLTAVDDEAPDIYARTLQYFQQVFSAASLRDLGLPGTAEAQDDDTKLPSPSIPALGVILNAYVEQESVTPAMAIQLYFRLKRLASEGHPIFAPMAATSVVSSHTFLEKFGAKRATLPLSIAVLSHMLPEHSHKVLASYGAEHILGRDEVTSLDQGPRHTVFSPPSTQTFSILLDSFCRHNFMGAAETVLWLMSTRNAPPSQVTWNILIRGHADRGNAKAVVHSMRRMERAGFKGDGATIIALKRHRNRKQLVEELERVEQAVEAERNDPEPEGDIEPVQSAPDFGALDREIVESYALDAGTSFTVPEIGSDDHPVLLESALIGILRSFKGPQREITPADDPAFYDDLDRSQGPEREPEQEDQESHQSLPLQDGDRSALAVPA